MACQVCETDEGTEHPAASGDERKQINCATCGSFQMSRIAFDDYRATVRPEQRWKVSAWLQDNAQELLTSDDVRHALTIRRPSLSQRSDRMIRWLSDAVAPGRYFDLRRLKLAREESPWAMSMRAYLVDPPLERSVPIGWNRDRAEACFMLIEVLEQELGFLKSRDGLYQVTAKGRLHVEGTVNRPSSIGFCAMWFAADMRYFYDDVLAPAIQACGYEPLRVDGAEHNGKIDDEIVASIRKARFVIADFSGHRAGVYYEAGFAHGLGLPVIFMCRSDQLAGLHFDVRQYNTIDWSQNNLEAVRTRLMNRIFATIGQGPLAVQSR